MRNIVLILSAAAIVAGCQVKPPSEEGQVYQRGVVSQEAGAFRFRLCHSLSWYSLSSPPELLMDQYSSASAGREGVPVYVEGWGSDTPDGWQLMQPRVIGGGLDECEETAEGAALRAFGHGPAWVADLSEDRIVVREAERFRSFTFSSPEYLRQGNLRRWSADIKRGRSRIDVALSVEPRPCIDRRGIWYALSAQLELEGWVFNGCARYGDLGRLDLASRYSTPAGEYLRDLHLLLRADGRARLIVDSNTEGQPLDVRTGHWRRLGSGRLLLETERDGGDQDTLLWSVEPDGSIRLVTDDPALGRGLRLVSSGVALQWPEARNLRLP
ncbi:hypothetical protein ACQUQP_09500 [Marinobacterium sp. YM272]|uniref:hypothetical protein n=1 Tax=Marinobacterium sp. YM272 TaxID=3421654 RepID=UPI003D7F803C